MQDNDLLCDVHDIAYNYDSKTGILHMAADNCCDMQGCIDKFKAIDPKVKLIITIAGAKVDTVYHRAFDNTWLAIAPWEFDPNYGKE